MIEFANWLYSTIPFIQLLGNRFNILGFFWFSILTSLTYYCLNKSDYSFGVKIKDKPKFIHNLGLLGISIFTVWVFYRFLDELLTIFTVVSWDSSLLSFSFNSLTFWFGKILSYSILFLGFAYLFKTLKINIFKMEWYSWIIMFFVAIVQRWSVSIFKVDYAVLTGAERITVFWKFYPILYISYAVLYLTVFKVRFN